MGDRMKTAYSALLGVLLFAIPVLGEGPARAGRLAVLVNGGRDHARVVCVPLIMDDGHGASVWSGRSDETPWLTAGTWNLILYNEDSAVVRSFVKIRAGQTATLRLSLPQASDTPQKKAVVEYDGLECDHARLYENVLSAMGRPRFCDQAAQSQPTGEMYRFLWLRSFHHPILIEATFGDQASVKVRFIETSGEGGGAPGDIVKDETLDGVAVLGKEAPTPSVDATLERIRGRAAEEGFWALAPEVEDGSILLDGSTWIIEGRRDGACKVVVRRNGESPTFRAFAEQLIRLSGKTFDPDENY